MNKKQLKEKILHLLSVMPFPKNTKDNNFVSEIGGNNFLDLETKTDKELEKVVNRLIKIKNKP